MAKQLVSPNWQPFAPTLQEGVFASRFPLEGRTLWLLINRAEHAFEGPQLEVAAGSTRYFDLWNGAELTPEPWAESTALAFPIEANGFGAVLATNSEPEAAIVELMSTMRERSARPLGGLSTAWSPLPQHPVAVGKTEPAASTPEGMIRIPAARFEFAVSGIEIEGQDMVGVDVQYAWEDSPRRHHQKVVDVASFFIDEYPVTNADFERFLQATAYRPDDDHNFLRHWEEGRVPAGWENKPVTWVSIEDARAYTRWAGKRLPREWEWQYAAQGTDGRAFPWGDDWREDLVPSPDTSRGAAGPAEVSAHPGGASPFGVGDLVGNVWQWTDEFVDDRTRAAVLRGGSNYQPQGSRWYFPQAYRLDQHGKYLLMAPSLDRSGTIGFRCVKDAG